MDDQKLLSSVEEHTFETEDRRKLACSDAFKIAGELNVELIDIARVCNENNIRISKCQLGCFN